MHDDPFLRPRKAAQYLGVHRTTIYKWVRDGVLPMPTKIGKRAVGWQRSQLDAVIAAHRAEVDQ